MRVGAVHLHPGAFRQFLVCRHFAPLIVRQGQALLCRDPEEHLTEALQDRFKYTLQSDGSWTIARLMP